MMTSETPTVRIAKIQLEEVLKAKPEVVQGTFPNGVSEYDLGLPTLEPSYSSDPDEEERVSTNPDLLLGVEDEEEEKAIQRYLDRTRNKKAEELLDKGWVSAPEPEEEVPVTARRPRLSVCMAAVSMMR